MRSDAHWPWVVLISVALSACATHRVERPQTREGEACALACDTARNECLNMAQSLADSDRQVCEARITSETARCQRFAADDKMKQACESQVVPCGAPTSGAGKCGDDHDLCVLRCGGRTVDR